VSLSSSDDPAVALAESLERHRAILDTAVDGIITISDRGIIESFNRAAERIFGYAAAEVVGRNISMLMPEPYRGGHAGYVANYVGGGAPKIIGIGREVEGLRKDGSVFPMELAVGEVRLQDRRMFTGITRDISKRKAAEVEARLRLNDLAHAARLAALGEMASGLAHEVNQPLTAIISHASACLRMMANGVAEPDLLQDSLRQIARQGERAGEVIKRLRRFVQKGEMEFRGASLNSIVQDVLWLVSHELKTAAVRVELDLADGLAEAQVDRVQIEQVVFNLVRNAIESMSRTPVDQRLLCIRTLPDQRRNAPAVRCVVEDSGPGFGDLTIAQLFEPYFTTKPDGLGQGLAICRSIIETHEGGISAESKLPSGARFSFWLPVRRAI
jgi:two-component system sensor kinase FixL